ncbi:MAG: hypothetical protein NUV51_10365, partial [Sulfuricaulis sp.]|nr:hypothetical protein [Sulfuricaulis sp.]
MTEQELMAYIRANMPTLTDVQSSPSAEYGSATAGQGLTTRYNSEALRNLFGDSAFVLPNLSYQVNGDEQTATLDPSQGYRFRVGDIEALYGQDGKLTDVFKQKPDSFMMQAMRAVMPAVALAAGGAAALGAGGVGAG